MHAKRARKLKDRKGINVLHTYAVLYDYAPIHDLRSGQVVVNSPKLHILRLNLWDYIYFMRQLSFLSFSIFLLLLFMGIFTIINYSVLSEGEGWGMVGVVSVTGILATGFILDIMISNLFRKKNVRNTIRVIAAIAYAIFFILFLNS